MKRAANAAALIVLAACNEKTPPAPQPAPSVAETKPVTWSPPPDGGTHDVTIDFNRRVKMRDGVELSADVYRPSDAGKFPVLLTRTPYVKAGDDRVKTARGYAARGFVYVAIDVRGRGDSDGAFVPYVADGQDGYDAIEWAAAQPWSTGQVVTIGGSYAGRIQWLTAVLQPPHLAGMVVSVTPSDPFVEWPTGLPLPLDPSWYHLTSGHTNQALEAVDWTKVANHLPVRTMDEAAGRPSAYWKEMIDHAEDPPYWEKLRYQDKFEKIKVPVLHVSGWYDDEQVGTPLNFAGMTTKGPAEMRAKQRLLVGPWGHHINHVKKLGEVDFGPSALIDLEGYIVRWVKSVVLGTEPADDAPVRVFVMGENRWKDEREWPIARTRFTKYFMHSKGRANSLFGDGTLTTTAAPADEASDKYVYDPNDPTPFVTEPSFAQIGGPDDYRSVERRDDVLVYSTPPLTEDVLVCGPIKAQLWAASSAPDTDFMAKLLDVWPNGFAQRLIDGMVRARFREGVGKGALLTVGAAYGYAIDMWNTCQRFLRGHAIRIELASAAFPKYDRNPNTGEPLGTGTKLAGAEQRILHDKDHPSHVLLPIVPAE